MSYEQHKQTKRYNLRLRRYGPCSVCQFREKAEAGFYHCRKWPDRQGGMCETDGKLPVFRLDDEVMQDLQGE